MSHDVSITAQQGHYRYNPVGLEQKGPARIFPYAGEDGVLRYILTKLRQNHLYQGQLSQPWTLLLIQLEATIQTLEEDWVKISTLLADWEIWQSGWFNFDLPPNEQFNASYVQERRSMGQRLLAATKAAEIANEQSQLSVTIRNELQRSLFYEALEKSGQGDRYLPTRPVVSLIWQRDGGLSDREFARQRLAGQNPIIIRRVQSAEQQVLQTWANHPYQLADGSTIDLIQSADANRLFIADYPLLQDLKAADLQHGRYVGSPVALFYRTESGLEPVLIEVEKGRVVTPDNVGGATDQWTRAKLYVQTADVTYHELISHLAYTHLAIETLAIATPRQLPHNHPLYRLLSPHLQFLLAINTRGNKILLGEGAAIDKLMAPTREASLGLINKAYRQRPFTEYSLLNDIQRRGIESEFLSEFPYRDDALLLWEAIAKYTTHYLQRYYLDDQAVQQDPYLQAWAAELGTPLDSRPPSEFPQAPTWIPTEWVIATALKPELPNYPRIPGFGAITSLQQLIDIATVIIFTSGPQHAAVNFSQFDYVNYVPNAPLALYSRPDTPSTLEELLPSTQQDLGQMQLTFSLSGIYWGKLGSADLIKFIDQGDRQILSQFQQELAEIENTIKTRNQSRLADSGVEYPYLLPSRIPNSINI
ncbi:lipoxygenase family protein [Calothrix sp. PCC 7507]|uniref:lipoxygenase family protein n=1 Tax=Calothrix sp. PCC 7507 TaxID=99598 RepID=UPI00029F0C01|nr:lipoxygenase family protein [Calothrix sp. PCC 7507]AFY34765.1 Arachidonate 15-lipoxygenase [Calothrix sp. PCC 7507]